MSWLFGSSSGPNEKTAVPVATTVPAEKPKPCCVCTTQKTARDDCMLFSKSDDPTQECKSLVEQYKSCMAGYGFKI